MKGKLGARELELVLRYEPGKVSVVRLYDNTDLDTWGIQDRQAVKESLKQCPRGTVPVWP